jgi:FAD synthase
MNWHMFHYVGAQFLSQNVSGERKWLIFFDFGIASQSSSKMLAQRCSVALPVISVFKIHTKAELFRDHRIRVQLEKDDLTIALTHPQTVVHRLLPHPTRR